NARKAMAADPAEKEHTKLLVQLLLDSGQSREAERLLLQIHSTSTDDVEVSQMRVRLHIIRHQVNAALAEAGGLQRNDNRPIWLVRLGEMFEHSRYDIEAEGFFNEALTAAFFPEAHLGLARLAVHRQNHNAARNHLLSALNIDQTVGERGQTSIQLFNVIAGQITALEDLQNGCTAFIATFPADATPVALARRSVLLYAQQRGDAEKYLDVITAAM